MKVGDLVRNKATGELAIVTGRGKGELQIWMTLIPFKNGVLAKDIVYLAEYFELVSEAQAEENNE